MEQGKFASTMVGEGGENRKEVKFLGSLGRIKNKPLIQILSQIFHSCTY